ncbi:MAG: chitobiase/beta-hexosaminidase C-terminal domain-containing protein [Verrucomicrobiales bacterium]|nr:chitobiase/beta-hexosaminidase C-terminal domain-containing protein [Verrucomicrobiales bacterium]
MKKPFLFRSRLFGMTPQTLSHPNLLKAFLMLVLMAVATMAAEAEVRLPRIFGNHMVLQRGIKLPVWGWAGAGENLSLTLRGQGLNIKVDTTADGAGKWRLELPVLKAGGPYVMTVSASNTVTFDNVMAGEVWLCSGQSNMEVPVGLMPGAGWWKGVFDYQQELASADNPRLRLFKVATTWQRAPIEDVNGTWAVSSPATAAGFSGTGYFFGRKLAKDLDVTVGLVAAAVGGMPIEQFSPHSGQAFWYNGMIAPVIPYGIRGAIWYQGETNFWAGDRANYFDKQKALIDSWRQIWKQGDFPFYLVQLAPGLGGNLPLFWEAQARSLSIKNTGIVSTNDIGGDPVHPRNKRGVGERLALWALAKDYGQDITFSGPTFKSMKVEGHMIRVSFDNVGRGLITRKNEPVSGFEIAGEGRFYPARALIDGNTVLVASKKVPKPSLVRLGWHHLSNTNLQNRAGLPAFPFRTGSSAPEISGKRLFKNSSTITLKPIEGNGSIHYTLDGSLPDKTSPVYANPIKVSKTTPMRARFYRSDGVMSSVAEAVFSKAQPRKHGVKILDLGVSYKYYEGSWAALPDFSQLKPIKTGITDDFTLAVADKTDGYALAFTGYLDVREPGLYTFQTTSDDGSALLVDGQLIVDNNGIHAPVTKSGEVQLRKGWRRIDVFFFEGGGGEALSVQYKGPDIPLQALPCWCEQGLASAGPLRVFTNKSGTTIKARVVSVSGNKVSLIRHDNRKFVVPVDSLSEEDQAYLEKWSGDSPGD